MLDLLGAERTMFIINEAMARHTHATVQRIERFVGAEPRPLAKIKTRRKDKNRHKQWLDPDVNQRLLDRYTPTVLRLPVLLPDLADEIKKWPTYRYAMGEEL